MAQYGKKEYWEERFSRDEQPFEWFQRYVALKPYIEQEIPKTAKILQVGCGTSRLAEDMFDDGYQSIKSIDFSTKAIELARNRAQDKTGLTYEVQDVLTLISEPESQYDAVIDKGTLDSLLCGDGSFKNVGTMLSGISRILKPGGVFIEISYGGTESRLPYFDQPELGWTVTTSTIPKPTVGVNLPTTDSPEVHYIYKCKKSQ